MAADTISFARGAPSLDIVDVEGLKEAAARAFANDPGGATAYGTAIGYAPLRAWIAEQHGVEPAEVVVTNGSMQADAFLFDELVEPSDTVVVERPTYDRTLLALRQRLADIRMVELEREALVSLAREHGFTIFEDDPDVSIRFAGDPLPTMLSLDRDETVVYASSFSKTVCPGIRVGYLVGPAELIARIVKRATSTYISPNMVAQAIVYEFCQSGALQRSIETVRTNLKARVDALVGALERDLPDARFVAPEGGYFMWVELPEGTDVDKLFAAAGERGVTFVKGSDFLLEGGRNTLRLAYSGVTPEQIDEGIGRLAEAYNSLSGTPAAA
jgi:2-aminoadipate transaminase